MHQRALVLALERIPELVRRAGDDNPYRSWLAVLVRHELGSLVVGPSVLLVVGHCPKAEETPLQRQQAACRGKALEAAARWIGLGAALVLALVHSQASSLEYCSHRAYP